MEIVHRYDRAARTWDSKIDQLGYLRAYRDFFAAHRGTRGPVLDVGAGTAVFSRAWLAEGGNRNLTLVDPSGSMLATALDRLEAEGVQAFAQCSTLQDFVPNHPFRTVLMAHVLEHCPDPVHALSLIHDILEPGGTLRLVVSKPHWCNWVIWLRFRHSWYSEDDVRAMARKAGLIHASTYHFKSGPPQRTSLGYVFHKSHRKIT